MGAGQSVARSPPGYEPNLNALQVHSESLRASGLIDPYFPVQWYISRHSNNLEKNTMKNVFEYFRFVYQRVMEGHIRYYEFNCQASLCTPAQQNARRGGRITLDRNSNSYLMEIHDPSQPNSMARYTGELAFMTGERLRDIIFGTPQQRGYKTKPVEQQAFGGGLFANIHRQQQATQQKQTQSTEVQSTDLNFYGVFDNIMMSLDLGPQRPCQIYIKLLTGNAPKGATAPVVANGRWTMSGYQSTLIPLIALNLGVPLTESQFTDLYDGTPQKAKQYETQIQAYITYIEKQKTVNNPRCDANTNKILDGMLGHLKQLKQFMVDYQTSKGQPKPTQVTVQQAQQDYEKQLAAL